ncbi:unnamed protein product [Ostreobium quekettii]|uniref:Uncharacterized protein n=1 Tax=Ostreobium quekettii TaxID=121088 RepID=A0A8S1IQQ0_9CHLO|nr:unnamed protein product [Ostreobium quekettii]
MADVVGHAVSVHEYARQFVVKVTHDDRYRSAQELDRAGRSLYALLRQLAQDGDREDVRATFKTLKCEFGSQWRRASPARRVDVLDRLFAILDVVHKECMKSARPEDLKTWKREATDPPEDVPLPEIQRPIPGNEQVGKMGFSSPRRAPERGENGRQGGQEAAAPATPPEAPPLMPRLSLLRGMSGNLINLDDVGAAFSPKAASKLASIESDADSAALSPRPAGDPLPNPHSSNGGAWVTFAAQNQTPGPLRTVSEGSAVWEARSPWETAARAADGIPNGSARRPNPLASPFGESRHQVFGQAPSAVGAAAANGGLMGLPGTPPGPRCTAPTASSHRLGGKQSGKGAHGMAHGRRMAGGNKAGLARRLYQQPMEALEALDPLNGRV